MQAAGFVLVGGNSSRFGSDKARLSVASRLLVETIAGAVMEAAGNVALVGAPERYRDLGMECLADRRPGRGPLSGIETALRSGRGEWNLIIACDMPGVRAEWLCALLEASIKTGALCTIAQDENGKVHPLLGVYRTGCLPFVQEALDQKRLKLMDVAARIGVSIFPIGGTVWNINTPQDWNIWQQKALQVRAF